MRTTLAIDDDVLAAVKELASVQRLSLGEVLSGLARKSLRTAGPQSATRNGIRLLPVRPDAQLVTSELVKQLDDELP